MSLFLLSTWRPACGTAVRAPPPPPSLQADRRKSEAIVLTVRRNVTPWAPAALALTALLAAGCAGQPGDDKPRQTAGSPSAGMPHGHVEGAEEAAEQQSRLLLNDPRSGDGRVLDLITGEVRATTPRPGTLRLDTDGRFGYFHTDRGTHVLDSGTWTVDHGDHVHYYRAAVRDVGDVPAGRDAQVRSDAAVTAVTDGEGRARLYDRRRFEQGAIGPARTLPGTYTGAVVPYAEHLVALTGGDGDGDGGAEVTVLDRRGNRVAAPDARCERPRGDAVTRRGVVLGCADGALLIREKDGGFRAERIPYGEDVPTGNAPARSGTARAATPSPHPPAPTPSGSWTSPSAPGPG